MPDASTDAISFEDLVVACPCCPVDCAIMGGRAVSTITPGAACCVEAFFFGAGANKWFDLSKVADYLQTLLTPGVTLQELSEAVLFIDLLAYDTQADCIAETGSSYTASFLPQMGCVTDPGGGSDIRWQISGISFDTSFTWQFITPVITGEENPLEFESQNGCASFFISLS